MDPQTKLGQRGTQSAIDITGEDPVHSDPIVPTLTDVTELAVGGNHSGYTYPQSRDEHDRPECPRSKSGYIVMLRARMFRSLIIRTGIKERNIRARNITI